MKPEVKAKWLEDLRSGKFQQGKSDLKDNNDRYCCLGVLASQFADKWVRSKGKRCAPARNGICLARGEFEDPSGYLSSEFVQEIGLTIAQSTLAEMNDSDKNFHQIANYIEKEQPCD